MTKYRTNIRKIRLDIAQIQEKYKFYVKIFLTIIAGIQPYEGKIQLYGWYSFKMTFLISVNFWLHSADIDANLNSIISTLIRKYNNTVYSNYCDTVGVRGILSRYPAHI